MAKTVTTKKSGADSASKTENANDSDNHQEDQPKKAKAKSSSPARKNSSSKKSNTLATISDSIDVLLPHTLGNSTGECTVLVQISPDDAASLDYHGSAGAVGRFQVDTNGIVLDLKGSQYQGTILPGPTVMVGSLHYTEDQSQQLRLETITDEFCPLVKTQDIMAKLDAQVEGDMDETYQVQEEDVNILARQEQQLENKQQKLQKKLKGKQKQDDSKTSSTKKTTTKRKAPSKARSTTSAGGKRQKSVARKKK